MDDVKVYAAILEKPGDGLPNVSKWYDTVASQLAKRFVRLVFLFYFDVL